MLLFLPFSPSSLTFSNGTQNVSRWISEPLNWWEFWIKLKDLLPSCLPLTTWMYLMSQRAINSINISLTSLIWRASYFLITSSIGYLKSLRAFKWISSISYANVQPWRQFKPTPLSPLPLPNSTFDANLQDKSDNERCPINVELPEINSLFIKILLNHSSLWAGSLIADTMQ